MSPCVRLALQELWTDSLSSELLLNKATIHDILGSRWGSMVEVARSVILASKTSALIRHDRILRGEK